jgi:hypothetical protein
MKKNIKIESKPTPFSLLYAFAILNGFLADWAFIWGYNTLGWICVIFGLAAAFTGVGYFLHDIWSL